MNKGIITGFLAVVVSLVFGTSLMAATTVPAQKMQLEKFNGVIENVNVANNDVLVQYHKNKMNFSVTGNTRIYEGNKALSLSNLNKGMWASVQYNQEGNQMLAQVIHVSAPRQESHVASSGTMSQNNMMGSQNTGSQNKMMNSEQSHGMK